MVPFDVKEFLNFYNQIYINVFPFMLAFSEQVAKYHHISSEVKHPILFCRYAYISFIQQYHAVLIMVSFQLRKT